MDEMMSSYVLQPNTFLYASFGLLLVQGFLFSFECLWRTLTGRPTRITTTTFATFASFARTASLAVFVVVLSLFAFWYFTTVILLVRNFEAMKQTWALNLIGVPTALVTVAECATFAYLWWTYDEHREQPFVNAMSFGSGVFLIGIAWWGLTLAHVPLRQGKEFAWNWLAIYGVFLVAYVAICYYNNLVVPTFIGGLVTVPYGFGMYESKQQLDAKKLR
ncbi:uncharacterized protein ACA1_076910 [Acanthamoeba castellanii str. Neff]|uniref:Transmembrane protein n=1 Tax=Acanthamoeba castellanii (strain ATCC 30010 / Neff) TaxID=1257118 RepID=L8GM60_ACACF|nr:uncharacterized protein ACA1_076910 [Acanthamoeba castellanii str. Neff]ELR13838.1 hypothetical protein ACA1_076910 [Acanthamoeba castellanii str. Neff]